MGNVVVVVVLTARLSLPGRAELNKLGRSGCVWEVVARLAVSTSVTMSTFALVKVAGSSDPGLYMVAIKELFRTPAADGEADNDVASVSIDIKLGDQEFPMTVKTPALFVLGGPIKPTDAEVVSFLKSHSLDAAGVLTLPAHATLKNGPKVQDLELAQSQPKPPGTPSVRKTSSHAAVTSDTKRQRDKRRHRRAASVGSGSEAEVSDRYASDSDSDSDKPRRRSRSVQVLFPLCHGSVCGRML